MEVRDSSSLSPTISRQVQKASSTLQMEQPINITSKIYSRRRDDFKKQLKKVTNEQDLSKLSHPPEPFFASWANDGRSLLVFDFESLKKIPPSALDRTEFIQFHWVGLTIGLFFRVSRTENTISIQHLRVDLIRKL